MEDQDRTLYTVAVALLNKEAQKNVVEAGLASGFSQSPIARAGRWVHDLFKQKAKQFKQKPAGETSPSASKYKGQTLYRSPADMMKAQKAKKKEKGFFSRLVGR